MIGQSAGKRNDGELVLVDFISFFVNHVLFLFRLLFNSYPVACGDRTCRESFVQCLQALHELDLEKQSQREAQQLAQALSMPALTAARRGGSQGHTEHIWVYGSNGVIPGETNLKPQDAPQKPVR